MKRQISFLGRATQDPTTGYQRVTYRFDDGALVESAFFGPALAANQRPQELLILGTAGSMWDVLLDAQGGAAASDEQRLELWDKAKRSSVTDEDLAQFEGLVGAHLGIPCRLRTIPYGRDAREQAALLATLAALLERGDEVTFDVTHGLRHLPMLMLAAGHYLERVRGVTVTNIVYGAMDMRGEDHVVPVVRLDGLLQVLDWVQALAAYDASGDFGVFAGLLEAAGASGAEALLKQAARYERMTNLAKARQQLTRLNVKEASADPLAELFLPELEQRLGWWRAPERWRREAAAAQAYLQRGDLLRAAIFGQEAVISRHTEEREQDIYDCREETRRRQQSADVDARSLFDIRNSLAHGLNAQGRTVRDALQDPDKLRTELEQLLNALLH